MPAEIAMLAAMITGPPVASQPALPIGLRHACGDRFAPARDKTLFDVADATAEGVGKDDATAIIAEEVSRG